MGSLRWLIVLLGSFQCTLGGCKVVLDWLMSKESICHDVWFSVEAYDVLSGLDIPS